MTRIPKYLISLAALMLMINLSAQDEKADTLRMSVLDAQNYAVTYNRSVKAAQIDIEIAKKTVMETTAIGLPQFAVSANYQHIFVVPEISFPVSGFTQNPLTTVGTVDNFSQFPGPGGLNQYLYQGPGIALGSKNNTTINFTLSQLIFSGEYIVGLQAAKIFKEVSEKAYIKSELTTKESVAGSYYLVLVLTENLRVLEQSTDLMNKTYAEMSQMNAQGFTEDTDVDQLKLNKSNLDNLVQSMKGQLDVSMKLLKFQLGMDFDQPLVLTDNLTEKVSEGNFQYMLTGDFNVGSSIDYQIMENQVDLQAANLRRAKSAFLPSLAGFYQHQEQTNAAAFNFQPKDVLGISLNIPIITSGQRIAKVSEGKLNLEKAELSRDMIEQNLVMEYESAKNAYQTAYMNYVNNKESLGLSEKIYNKNLIKYKEGVASSLEMTQSQSQYLTAESNYYNSINALLQAKAKLDRILMSN
ncbi:MAG: TolC family protein [Bacteroidales bacterium]|nr:TolC family protein [Bacteroidales bacterium]MCB9000204.1 TolC family protein [Bacteroidales bacterium]MCB9013717.1 TolC family protein [Bacteroidales bacterium]